MEVPKHAAVIAGRYRLESLIGEGGMAAVWRAEDQTLKRKVAVKLLYARDDRDRQRLVNRFGREARIAAAVQHRNVVHIVDFGTTQKQIPFMVMELLHGESLGHRMHRDPPLELTDIVHVAGMTLRGLAAVHDAGIVHRDLKPDNIFLHQDGKGSFPKILDFGISRSVEPRSGRRSALTTKEGLIVGTPEYMSPEQARGIRTVSKRSDIYSMGVILYEALAGKLPFSSENVGDLIIQIVTSRATPLHESNPEIPQSISEVVATAMQRDPEDRFADAMEMRSALYAAAKTDLGEAWERFLSDIPPPNEPTEAQSKNSHQRLRTINFPLDVQSDATEAAHKRPPLDTSDFELEPHRSTRGLKHRAAFVGAGLSASALGLGLAAWLVTRDSSEDARASIRETELASTTTQAASTPAEPERREPESVVVQLRGVPEDAIVTVDGAPSQSASLELARDGRNRIIRVSAPGRAPWQVVHHASADASYEVLLPAPPPEHNRDTARQSPRKRKSSPATSTRKRKTRSSTPRRTRPPSALRNLDF